MRPSRNRCAVSMLQHPDICHVFLIEVILTNDHIINVFPSQPKNLNVDKELEC